MNGRLSVTDIYTADILTEIKPTIISSEGWEIIYVIKGEISITSDANVLKLQEGMLVLHKPLESRSVWSLSDQAEYISVNFGCKDYNNFNDNNVFNLSPYTQALVQRLCQLSKNQNVSTDEFLKTLELILICISNEQSADAKLIGRDITIFSDAISIMNDKVEQQLSVEVIADTLGVSLSKIKRIFAQYTLIGVHEYFLGLKVNYAKGFLAQGESVTRVSELAGFNNQNYFSSSFKRVTGVSPKDYIKAPKKKTYTTNIKQKAKRERELPSYLL